MGAKVPITNRSSTYYGPNMESLLIRSKAPLPIGGASCIHLEKICDKLVPQSHFLLLSVPARGSPPGCLHHSTSRACEA